MRKTNKYSRKVLQKVHKRSDLEVIRAYHMQQFVELLPHDTPIELNEHQMMLNTRWVEVFDKLKDSTNKGQVRKWAEKEYGISAPTAWVLINNALRCFGEIQVLPKRTARAGESILLEKTIEALEQDYKEDKLTADQYYALLLKYRERLHKLNDLDNPDVVDIDELKKALEIGPRRYTTDPEALKTKTIDIDHKDVT